MTDSPSIKIEAEVKMELRSPTSPSRAPSATPPLMITSAPFATSPVAAPDGESDQFDVGGSEKLDTGAMDKQTLLAVMQFLRKNNLKDTEQLLLREAKGKLGDDIVQDDKTTTAHTDTNGSSFTALTAYKCEGDPSLYEDHYQSLQLFIDRSLDVHKCELACLFYPVFVHMYLELVSSDQEEHARAFFDKFRGQQEGFYEDDLIRLSMVTKSDHLHGNQFLENYRSNQFVIRMSRESYNHLKRHLVEKKLTMLLNIIQDHLCIDVFDGAPRSKQQIEATSGAMLGDAKKDANKQKIYYGLLKEPDITINAEEEEPQDPPANQNEDGKPSNKRRRAKKDPQLTKKSKNDPNAPPANRIPLPEVKDSDKLERIQAFREASKRVTLGPDNPPSVCFYTFVNSFAGVTCAQICEDSSMLAAGFADSSIRVWSLTAAKLCAIKPPDELNLIDKEAEDVLERIMDERTASESKTLRGHSGPVYSTCFSPDKAHLISASQDGTVRLWSLQTWSNLVCYRGHLFPVWDVKFGPYGHYFVTGSADRTARLWSTDHHLPLRIFAGHLADVDCVEFHPNSNYIATGSTDRQVRLWDVLTGQCVRFMTGHKGAVHAMTFSPDGRYLASAGVDKLVLLWDISTGDLVAQFSGHEGAVYSLAFSREAAILASGSMDNTIRLWDAGKVFAEQDSESGQSTVASTATEGGRSLEIDLYRTKSTPILALHFTRRNLLLASGPFVPISHPSN